MDWKYKHFQQERIFAETRDVVIDAARAFMTESLGWKIATATNATHPAGAADIPNVKTADGFTTQGYSWSHKALATLHMQSVSGGTKVAIELLVERAGWRGFMLFDVGGYYSIQMRKWLDGIQWTLHQKLADSRDESTNPLVLAEHKPAARVFNGCLVFIVASFALYFLVTFVSAVVGLLTGNLFLLGRGSLTIHGTWARIVSGLILLFIALLAWKIRRKK